jgi:hypothetical protein
MAGLQATIGLGRTRSLRLAPKPALTAPASKTAAAVNAPAPPTASAQIPTATSHVSLFLTNLRLLDLDLDEDWPGITHATFSSKDAVGGQKKRIQCVEWALYQLFVLWDPLETQNKLRPFFPPLDQIQSINLRAALLRGLEQAKRNGVLGRDAVIRKTMLDECKGERFEEVLAVFSSAVLKKLVAERALNSGTEYRPTIAENIALENWGYSGDRTELNGLILAHKASLRSGLAQKKAARARYQDFQELLELKGRNLARRKEQVKADAERNQATAVSSHLKKQTRQILKATWTGNDQWVNTILCDESSSYKGGLLSADFNDVWAGVREGRLTDLEDNSTGLLEQLDHRVRLQRSRLEKWQGFRNKLFGAGTSLPTKPDPAKEEERVVDLGFTAHRYLQANPGAVPSFDASTGPPEYAEILGSLRTELGLLGKPAIPDFSKLRTTRVRLSGSLDVPIAPEPISDLSEWEDKPEEAISATKGAVAPATTGLREFSNQLPQARPPKRPVIQHRPTNETTRIKDENHLITKPEKHQTMDLPLRPAQDAPAAIVVAVQEPVESPTDYAALHEPELLSPDLPEQTPRSKKEADVLDSSPTPLSPTQAMADRILASMSNASPSPEKKPRHTLSLAERTRMSMSRNVSFEPDDDDPLHLSPSLVRSSKMVRKTTPPEGSGVGEEYEDLIARTRRSMVGYDAARQKAQLDRRRSLRQQSKASPKKDGYFPKTDEDTVDASIIEELMDGQEDMEAVFKSRPKMRISPAPSPVPGWDRDE